MHVWISSRETPLQNGFSHKPDSPEESGNLLYVSESTQTRALRNLYRIYLALHHPTLPSDNSATRAPECVQNPRC